MTKPPSSLKPEKLYRWITRHPDPERAVAALSTPQLRELNCHLARDGAQSGIPSLVHGLILHEAAGRLMIQDKTKES